MPTSAPKIQQLPEDYSGEYAQDLDTHLKDDIEATVTSLMLPFYLLSQWTTQLAYLSL